MNNYNSSIMSTGGRFYWARNSNNNNNNNNNEASKGIVVVFGWVSVSESQLNVLVSLYSSFGWNSLVSRADYLNPFIPERATSLAFTVLNELIKELRRRPCPVVFASFSGGSKACMYKVFQIIGGCAELDFGLEDSRLVASCISGQIYDSDPIEFTSDLGARFALHRSILKMPGSSKLVSLFAKGITSGLDALFLTRFGSQREEYWQTLYSSVGLETPFLVLCSEKDDVELLSTLYNFVQHLQDAGANVKLVKSPLIGNSKLRSTQYKAAVTEILEQAVSNFPQKIQMLGEKSQMDDFVSDLICDLQNAAVDSCQSFKRVAAGPNDHFFLPSLAESRSSREIGSLQEERKERSPVRSIPSMSANTVLGQILFDVCVPKNVEGWDVKFSGSLNGEPFASVRRRSPYRAIKLRSRL